MKSQSLLSEGKFSHIDGKKTRFGERAVSRNPFLVRESFLIRILRRNIALAPGSQSLLSEGKFSHFWIFKIEPNTSLSCRNPFLVRESFLIFLRAGADS